MGTNGAGRLCEQEEKPSLAEGAMPSAIPFDAAHPDVVAARRILLACVRHSRPDQLPGWGSAALDPYVEYAGAANRDVLGFYVAEAFWQLVVEGILAPGMNVHNMNLPWFHVTAYGEKVLDSLEPDPHDPVGYLDRIREAVGTPDATALAYISESLEVYRRGNHVAAAILLGIAAERVFILVCESLINALSDPSEARQFRKILDRYQMKPKLDWVHAKIEALQARRDPGFPDNALIALTTIYDLLRGQRNELGHPRDLPPAVKRDDVFVNLQVFPRYYQIAEEMRAHFAINRV
jgi:hypothetical protein